MRFVLAALAVLATYPVAAQQRQQPASQPNAASRPAEPLQQGRRRLQDPAGENIFVWFDSRAHAEGLRLLHARVTQTSLLLPLIACVASSGTEVVVTERGFSSSTILVVAGPDSGCRGVVENEWISRPPQR